MGRQLRSRYTQSQRYQRGLPLTGSRTNLAYRSRVRFFLCTLLAALLLPVSARSEVLGEIHSQYRDGLIWLKVDVTGKSEPLHRFKFQELGL